MGLRNLIYNGKLLPEFCLENNISFNEFESRFKRMRSNKKLDEYSDEYLIEYIIKNFYSRKTKTNSPYNCKYFVDGEPLGDYARHEGVSAICVRAAVATGLKKYPDANTSDLAKDFIRKNKTRFKYTYDGYPLSIICRKYNISNVDVLRVFYDEYPERNTMTVEEKNAAIKDIVDMFINGKQGKVKGKGLKYGI